MDVADHTPKGFQMNAKGISDISVYPSKFVAKCQPRQQLFLVNTDERSSCHSNVHCWEKRQH